MPKTPAAPVAPEETSVPQQADEVPEEAQQPRKLALRTQIGILQTDLYERLFKPAFMCFAMRHDDEPLRQLVESIVTSIAMHDAYDGYRKLNDICQRYLYYLESVTDAKSKSWESIQTCGLCDYWRTQVFMALIRDSAAIFNLLLPESQFDAPEAEDMLQSAFLDGCDFILNDTVGCVSFDRAHAYSRDFYDFLHGVSFPWLGYQTESLFNIREAIADDALETVHEFAIASAEQSRVFWNDYQAAVQKKIFTDLVFSQHRKVYEDICEAFASDESLPQAMIETLSQRIKLDKAYQNLCDCCLGDREITSLPHRTSRLLPEYMESFRRVGTILRFASQLNAGVYLFHYLG